MEEACVGGGVFQIHVGHVAVQSDSSPQRVILSNIVCSPVPRSVLKYVMTLEGIKCLASVTEGMKAILGSGEKESGKSP
jgi:hypothetical protein